MVKYYLRKEGWMYIEYADINDNFEIISKYLFVIEYLLRSSKESVLWNELYIHKGEGYHQLKF